MGIESLIQGQRPVWRQYLLLAILLIALIIDGLDLQLLSLVAPLLITEWNVSRAALGPAMSAAVFGMSVGALVGGWLGDRFGRKPILLASMLVFASATLAASWSSSLTMLTVLRVVGGLGFGAAAPNAMTLATEWLGGSLRLRAIGWMSIGTPLGGLVGALILIGYLSDLGWRGSFLLCGLLSFVAAVLVLAVVPETPSFLLRRKRHHKLEAVLVKWFGHHQPVMPDTHSDQKSAAGAYPANPSEVAPVTVRFVTGTGFGFFCISFVAYGCAAWLPVMVTMNGLPVALGLRAVLSFNLLAVTVAVLAGVLAPYLGTRRMMAFGAALAALALVILMVTIGPLRSGPVAWGEPVLFLGAAMAGAGTGTVLASLYMVLASGYPQSSRSTGVGLGMTLGRGGGIASTFSGGYLLGESAGTMWPFFTVMALGVVGTVVGLLLIDRHIARQGQTAAVESA